MNRTILLVFTFLLQFTLNTLMGYACDENPLESHPCSLHNWKSKMILESTKTKPARTAILIIAPPALGNGPKDNYWKLGKKVWELYMNSHPKVDCYFIQCTYPRKEASEQVWIEGNTIYVGDEWYANYHQDRILYKTIKALELLGPNYTHFIRTNLNTFVNLKAVHNYMKSHHQSIYTAPLWQSEWYTIGYGIIFSADVAEHMVKEYFRLESANEELISSSRADDCALTALATGIWPLDQHNPFVSCPKLPCGIRQLMCKESLDTTRLSQYGVLLRSINSVEEAISYIDQARKDVILYRLQNQISLEETAQIYEHLLNKVYPQLSPVDLLKR